MRRDIHDLLARARETVASMTPEQKAQMYAAQARSWVRAMTATCEHGQADFEQCPDCRGWKKDAPR